MKKLYKKKKVLNSIGAMALASVMLTSCATATTATTTESNANVVVQTMDIKCTEQLVETSADNLQPLFEYPKTKPSELTPARTYWINNETGQKFSVYPMRAIGCGNSEDQKRKVDIYPFTDEYITLDYENGNPAFLEGIANYGYPTVDAETLIGNPADYYNVTPGELEYAAFCATIIAVWSRMEDNVQINKWKIERSSDFFDYYPDNLKKDALKAAKEIYKKASEYQLKEDINTVSFTAGEPQKIGNNYEVVFTLENPDKELLESELFVEMREVKAFPAQERESLTFPEGLRICDDAGKEYTKAKAENGNEQYVLPAGTSQFKVILQDPGEAGTQVDLRLLTKEKKPVLLFATSLSNIYTLIGDAYENLTAGFAINKDYETYSELQAKEREKYEKSRGEVTVMIKHTI